MKKIFILWIILSLLLSSCSIDWNDEKDKKIAELEKQIQNDLFKKKQECEKYIDQIKEKLKKEYYDWNTYITTFLWMYYDKKNSSCVYDASSRDIINKKDEKFLYDILLDKKIAISDTSCLNDPSCKENSLLYYKKLKELKWE